MGAVWAGWDERVTDFARYRVWGVTRSVLWLFRHRDWGEPLDCKLHWGWPRSDTRTVSSLVAVMFQQGIWPNGGTHYDRV